MHPIEEIDAFAKSICDAVGRAEYSGLESIMRIIFLKEEKFAILIDLADRLPSSVFEAFFLCGLTYLINMNDCEYKDLFRLSMGRDIAIYQLTRFVIIHGGARELALKKLSVDIEEIRKIKQFDSYLKEGNILPHNEQKMAQLIYRDYQVPIENILAFREKFFNISQQA